MGKCNAILSLRALKILEIFLILLSWTPMHPKPSTFAAEFSRLYSVSFLKKALNSSLIIFFKYSEISWSTWFLWTPIFSKQLSKSLYKICQDSDDSSLTNTKLSSASESIPSSFFLLEKEYFSWLKVVVLPSPGAEDMAFKPSRNIKSWWSENGPQQDRQILLNVIILFVEKFN
jgi:hypothetical protein